MTVLCEGIWNDCLIEAVAVFNPRFRAALFLDELMLLQLLSALWIWFMSILVFAVADVASNAPIIDFLMLNLLTDSGG